MKTPIDKCQDYTHSKEFKESMANTDLKKVMRKLADALQRLQNITSTELAKGIYEFDLHPDEISLDIMDAFENFRRIEVIK